MKTNRKRELVKKNETDKHAQNGNIIAIVAIICSSVLAIVSIAVTVLSLGTQRESVFYERVFQPLTYGYTPMVDSEETKTFDNYTVPAVSCKATFYSGFPTQITVINSDGKLENMYTYSAKTGVEPLTDLSIEFPLDFKSLVFYEQMAYQYIFIYVEGSDGSWHLDCMQLCHNTINGETDVTILVELDMLRLEFEQDEARRKVLAEYQRVHEVIAEIKNQK